MLKSYKVMVFEHHNFLPTHVTLSAGNYIEALYQAKWIYPHLPIMLLELEEVKQIELEEVKQMPQCPDCQSNSVQSKGWRVKGVHRYLCNNCGRNFTVDTRHKEELKEVKMEKQEKEMTTMTNIAVTKDVRQWIEGLKFVKQEPLNSVLERLRHKIGDNKEFWVK